MYDTLRAVIAEKEVGTLCRLFDGDSLTSNLGNNSQWVSTEQTSLSLGGFIQVKNFLSEVYPAMISSQNGFEERFLYAVVKPKAMTRRETQVIKYPSVRLCMHVSTLCLTFLCPFLTNEITTWIILMNKTVNKIMYYNTLLELFTQNFFIIQTFSLSLLMFTQWKCNRSYDCWK